MQKNLEKTCRQLANTQEDLRKCQYTVKERDFIISEQRKAGEFNVFLFLVSYSFINFVFKRLKICETENALTHQACVLRAELEKSLQENALLFSKLGMHSSTGTE